MKVAIVEYINAVPFLHGLKGTQFEIIKAHPAQCAKLLEKNVVDIALLPVGALEEKEAYIIGNYGIGASGQVKTVCLYGMQPRQKWKKVYLDYQSRTSNALTRILFEQYFQQNMQFALGDENKDDALKPSEGKLLIGDRNFHLKEKYPYKYDLGQIWMDWMKLPFVFASWISYKQLPSDQIKVFKKAISRGLEDFRLDFYPELLKYDGYFKNNIDYNFSDEHLEGMKKFLYLKNSQIKIKFI